MAEWSIASVLKTDEGHTSGGSNPSLSAIKSSRKVAFFAFEREVMRPPGFVTAMRFRSEAEKESLFFFDTLLIIRTFAIWLVPLNI